MSISEMIDNGFNVRDEYKSLTDVELKEISNNDRLNYSILFLNLEKNLNVSNLIRTGHLMGASNFFIIGSTRYDRRGTVGSQNYINIKRIECDPSDESVISCINKISQDYNMKMVFLEQSENSIDLSSIEFFDVIKDNHCCIVIGNEGTGISKDVISNCATKVVEINQLGVIRSINAAVAGGIVMYKIKEILD